MGRSGWDVNVAALWIIGDIHGHYARLQAILSDAGMLGPDLSWSGRDAALWFVGDFTDRGPDGIAVLDLVMRLQREARESGGSVGSLLGNHDALLVAARRFGDRPSSGPRGTFLGEWRADGGAPDDLTGLMPEHVEWITRLPAMALIGDLLLIHADARFYTRYGSTIAAVNRAIGRVLSGSDDRAWDRLLGQFSGRNMFVTPVAGAANARSLLDTFGGSRIAHGHTPISHVTGAPPETVTAPLMYAGGLCVNVDGGIYLGGPGFAWQALLRYDGE